MSMKRENNKSMIKALIKDFASLSLVLIVASCFFAIFFSSNYLFRLLFYSVYSGGILSWVVACIVTAACASVACYVLKTQNYFQSAHLCLERWAITALFIMCFVFLCFYLLSLVSLFISQPFVGDHALKLVQDYESLKGYPILTIPMIEKGFTCCSSPVFISKENNAEGQAFLVFSVGGYEEIEVFLSPEYVSKGAYVVYNLKGNPKLLKFTPKMIDDYSKHVKEQGECYDKLTDEHVILDIESAVNDGKVKPVSI